MPDDMLPSVAPPNLLVRVKHEHRHMHKHEHRDIGPKKAAPPAPSAREMHEARYNTSTSARDRAYTNDPVPISRRPVG